MNLFPALTLAPAMAAPQNGSNSSSPLAMLPLLLAFLVIFYFLLWRPQAKRQKEHKAMLAALKKGDRIVTNGGLYATVLNVKENEGVVVASIADGVKVEIAQVSIATVVKKK